MNHLLESVEVNQTYEIESTITNQLYIDTNRNAYLFFVEEDAKRFVYNTPDVRVGAKAFRKPKELFESYYRYGILTIIVTHGLEEEQWNLNRKKVALDFYNNQLNAAIHLFQQTKSVKYLRIIASSYFIVPVRMNFESTSEIVYGTLHVDANTSYFVAFTDMKDYQNWNQNMVGWHPLLVNFDVMCQISKDIGYVVNPQNSPILLPSSVMEQYRKYAVTDDPILIS